MIDTFLSMFIGFIIGCAFMWNIFKGQKSPEKPKEPDNCLKAEVKKDTEIKEEQKPV